MHLCMCMHAHVYGYLHSTGAAIIRRSAQSIVPSVYEKTFFNPLCFIQFENATTPPSEIKQVNKYTILCMIHC